MSHRRSLIALLAMCGLVLGASLAVAGNPAKGDAPKDAAAKAAADAKMAEEMMKMGQPGPEHQMLAKCEGTWKAVNKSWMSPGEPTTSEGTSEFKMILGGRFLEQRFNGTFMGQPFEGYGLSGYDNITKKYSMFWVDNSGTSMMNGTGSYDEAKKTVTWRSSFPGPDGKMVNARMTDAFTDDNTQVFTMYTTEKGKENKVMEITYTRQTSASQ